MTGQQRYFVARPDGSGALARADQVDWEAVLADLSCTVSTGRGTSLRVLSRQEVEALRDAHRDGHRNAHRNADGEGVPGPGPGTAGA